MGMNWDLVIFDCDGVLVDSEPIAMRLFSVMLREIGLSVTDAEVRERFVGQAMPAWLHVIEGRLGRSVPPGFVPDFYTRLEAAFRQELRAIPGVAEVLGRLTAPMCVASNAPLAKVQSALRLTGLLPFFEGRLFSATELAGGKPSPDLLLYVARCMKARPSRCAVVEDSPLGVQVGMAAKMPVFGYAAGLSDSRALAAAGARVFFHMEELPSLLQRSG
jgi:HAD superfamily hydrolase (TIGR01509 family)